MTIQQCIIVPEHVFSMIIAGLIMLKLCEGEPQYCLNDVQYTVYIYIARNIVTESALFDCYE